VPLTQAIAAANAPAAAITSPTARAHGWMDAAVLQAATAVAIGLRDYNDAE